MHCVIVEGILYRSLYLYILYEHTSIGILCVYHSVAMLREAYICDIRVRSNDDSVLGLLKALERSDIAEQMEPAEVALW